MKMKLDLGAELDILSPDEYNAGVDRLGQLWRDQAYGVKHMRAPLLQGAVTGTGGLLLGSQSSVDQDQNPTYCGPRSGYAWQVKRVSVFGLAGIDTVQLYFGEPVPQKFVQTITAAIPWDSSKGLLLKPGDYLVIFGSGLTTEENTVITVNAEVVEAPAEQIYKLTGG